MAKHTLLERLVATLFTKNHQGVNRRTKPLFLAGVALTLALAVTPTISALATDYTVDSSLPNTPPNYLTLNALQGAGIAWNDGDTLTIRGDDNSLTGSLNFGNSISVTIGGYGTVTPVTSVGTYNAISAGTNSTITVLPDADKVLNFDGFDVTTNGGAISGGNGSKVNLGTVGSSGTLVFMDNSAGNNGGAVDADGTVEILGGTNTFSRNTAGDDGGAIGGQSVAIFGGANTFNGNKAGERGGAIFSNKDVMLSGGTNSFLNNHAGTLGGAVFADENGTFIAVDGDLMFRGNTQGTGNAPNAIYMGNYQGSRVLNLAAEVGKSVLLYDPVESNLNQPNLTIHINKTGADPNKQGQQYTGTVLFDTHQSNVYGNTTVHNGTMQLANGAIYGSSATTNPSFTLKNGATLSGTGKVNAATHTVSGTLSPGDAVGTIGTLTLVGDVVFSDAVITVDTDATANDRVVVTGAASIEAGKSLSLGVGPTASLTATSFDFNGTGKLNITGYTPGSTTNFTAPFQTTTVITTTGGVSNFNPLITVANQANADFLSASAYQDGNDVKVETRLTWNSTDPNRPAHGDFTVDSGTFTLGAVLADNSASTNRRNGWDGKSLTKFGSGTLILTGDNTTDGDLNHEAGTVDLRGKWSGNYLQAAGTTLNTHDNTSIGKVGGTSSFKGVVNPSGTLSISGDANFDNATVDFGLLTAGNKIVVGGRADINSVTMRVDAANIIDSSSYTLTEFDTVDTSGIHVISVKNLGENRGGEYIKNNALKFDVIVGSTVLTWTGSQDDKLWSAESKDRSWDTPNITTYFKNGDDVNFSIDAANINKSIDVASAITVGTMDVSAAGYTFNIDLDKDGSITADQFTNTGDAVIVATKNDATGLGRGENNKTLFTVVTGANANTFASGMSFQSTNARIKYDLFSDPDALGFWIYLLSYADEYGSRLSRNGNRMAGLIDTLPSGNGFLAALDALTDDALILSGIENATGEAYAASMDGTAKLQRTFNDLLIARKTAGRSQCDPCAPACGSRSRYELWGTFTGGSHDRSGLGRYSGYDLSNYGVAFGIEREISNRWFGGVAFGYDNATQKLDDRVAKDEFEAFRASVYGGYTGRSWYASGYAGYSKNWHDLKRDNYALGFSNRGKYDDDVFSTGLEVGKVLKLRGGARFIPSIGVHWIHLDNPTFTERGDLASSLRISSSQYDSVRLPIGARLNKTFTNRSISWTPEVRAFYVAELADTCAGLNTAFVSGLGSGSAFADSGDGGRSGGQFGAGLTAQLTTRLSVGIDYDYEVWEHYDRHNLTGNVTVRW